MTLLPGMTLPLWSAIPLILLFAIYLIFVSNRAQDEETTLVAERSYLYSGILWFFIGCATLYLGGELVVRNAVSIGGYLGISEAILGLTVVAFGTSIPDTMASIAAVRKSGNRYRRGQPTG